MKLLIHSKLITQTILKSYKTTTLIKLKIKQKLISKFKKFQAINKTKNPLTLQTFAIKDPEKT